MQGGSNIAQYVTSSPCTENEYNFRYSEKIRVKCVSV